VVEAGGHEANEDEGSASAGKSLRSRALLLAADVSRAFARAAAAHAAVSGPNRPKIAQRDSGRAGWARWCRSGWWRKPANSS